MTLGTVTLNTEGCELLLQGAAELGVPLDAEALAQFGKLYELLVETNARYNLTALKTERDIVLKHFVDSLSCLQGEYLAGELRVLDLGTGAGFPSLPLAIVQPDLHLVPLDSIRKKVAFVETAAQALGLEQVKPQTGRAETLGRDAQYRGQFDRVVARAVASLPELVELALPLLRVGGYLVAQKGDLTAAEQQAGSRAAAELGGEIGEIQRFALPILGDQRTLVVVQKRHPTPAKYPRREGIPHQQPLFWKAK